MMKITVKNEMDDPNAKIFKTTTLYSPSLMFSGILKKSEMSNHWNQQFCHTPAYVANTQVIKVVISFELLD